MRKLLKKWLGTDASEAKLRDALAKAKSEQAKTKEKLQQTKTRLDAMKAYMASPLVRLLQDAKDTRLTEEQRQQIIESEHRITFSQSGEDIAAAFHLAGETEKGVIVDIGAYHPFRFSNTFLLHLQGWPCVSVDASQDAIDLFNQVRPADTNVCCLVSDKEETLEYFQFAEGAWNTTRADSAAMLENRGLEQTKLVSRTRQTTVPIMQLLEQHVGEKKFDLLDIDVEGMDAKLLLGIDLKRFRPKVILAEIGRVAMTTDPLRSHLAEAGYEVRGHCGHTCVIVRGQPD